MNPILPLHYAAPDGEPHVWRQDPDTLYLYATNELVGCSGDEPVQHVWSTRDLIAWEEHVPGFDAREAVDFEQVTALPASDCIEKDGKFYYYFTAGGRQCVAFSDSPQGPFLHAVPIPGTEFPSCGDPAVFVDEDGSAYLYWGQFYLKGCRLKENMCELETDTVRTMLLTEEEHGFHEGSSMRRRGDLYYLIYCDTDRGAATCLSYAVGRSPLGPFEKRGVIIDNAGCDLATWNNHGSIVCFHDRWYILYHKACFALEMGGRKACMEPISFDENGDIPEVPMTTQGVEGPIPASRRLEAYRACHFEWIKREYALDREVACFYWKEPVTGWRRTAMDAALRNSKDTGVRAAHYIESGVHREYLTRLTHGDCIFYRYLDFGSGVREFVCSAASHRTACGLEIHIDGAEGPVIGRCEIGDTGGFGPWNWQTFRCQVEPVTGVHEVCLKVLSHRWDREWLCDLDWLQFS